METIQLRFARRRSQGAQQFQLDGYGLVIALSV
mgnify:CR=1 FL=1